MLLMTLMFAFACSAKEENGLQFLLKLVGLPQEGRYVVKINQPSNSDAIGDSKADRERESTSEEKEASGFMFTALLQDGLFVGMCELDFYRHTEYGYCFYDGMYVYDLLTASGHVVMTEHGESFCVLGLANQFQPVFSMKPQEASEILEQFDLGKPFKAKLHIDADHVLSVELREHTALRSVLRFECLLSSTKSVLSIIDVEIEPLINPLPDELFIPNGFGDRRLCGAGSCSGFNLFVRDFLPSSEELKVLMVSEEARREYEAESRSRPRVGPIDKYSKPLDLSKYK
jgi:hypothetical protein